MQTQSHQSHPVSPGEFAEAFSLRIRRGFFIENSFLGRLRPLCPLWAFAQTNGAGWIWRLACSIELPGTALEFDQHDPLGEDFSHPDVGDVPMKKT